LVDDGCPACGYRNPLGARFCSSCGHQLRYTTGDEATEAHQVAGAATTAVDAGTGETGATEETFDLPAGTVGMFVVREGPKRGSRIALDTDEVLIGRHPESDIFLDDVTVSRRHAVVTRAGDGFRVADAGSLNGTYVNQERVDDTDLHDGDEVQVGKFKLVYLAVGSIGG
jgi:hypothetical protein